MKNSEQLDQLAAALAKAQGDLDKAKQSQEAVVLTKAGGQYSYGYATLADIWDACRKHLSDNGLAIIQAAETVAGGVEITTVLVHSSGQWVSSSLVLSLDGGTPQAIGSAITYGRRYGLAAMVGIAPAEDDDGQAAEKIGTQAPKVTEDRTQHWCEVHQTAFFKRGQMRGYAHPIGDTKEWCNEPSEGTEEPAKATRTIAAPIRQAATPPAEALLWPAKANPPPQPSQPLSEKPATLIRPAVKPDPSMVDTRPHELAEAIRKDTKAFGSWEQPANELQLGALTTYLKERVEEVTKAIYGDPNISGGRAAAILGKLGGTSEKQKATANLLFRIADEAQTREEQDDGDQEADLFHPEGVGELDEDDEAERP